VFLSVIVQPNPTHTQMTACVLECIWLNIYIYIYIKYIRITEIMISFVTACISLFRLGVLYDVKSPKMRPYVRPSVCEVFSETAYLVSLS
jgi:hypothetical protein